LVKYLDGVSDADIPELEIPTGIPLVYELDERLHPLARYYLGPPLLWHKLNRLLTMLCESLETRHNYDSERLSDGRLPVISNLETNFSGWSPRRGYPTCAADSYWDLSPGEEQAVSQQPLISVQAAQNCDRTRLKRVLVQASKNPPDYACTRRVKHKFPSLILHAGA
jgi:hypothetical protein